MVIHQLCLALQAHYELNGVYPDIDFVCQEILHDYNFPLFGHQLTGDLIISQKEDGFLHVRPTASGYVNAVKWRDGELAAPGGEG